MNYKDAGVDIQRGDLFVEKIKRKVQSTYNHRVVEGVGGFSSLYDISADKYLAAGTDGVGTKLKLAIELNKHDTIGIDLVAMCVNDILCVGANPLFFMDYIATSSLDLKVSEEIINGIVEGCQQSEMALIGGETAEMPDVYNKGDYDLAGFGIGEVLKKDVINGKKIANGDKLIGVSSTGFHSNGFSLIRKLIKNESSELKKKLLTPTRIYHSLIKELRSLPKCSLSGISHITGGGIDNIKRMNTEFKYSLNSLPDYSSLEFKSKVTDTFDFIAKKSKLNSDDLYKTFNMGIGLVIATNTPDLVIETTREHGYLSWEIGSVV